MSARRPGGLRPLLIGALVALLAGGAGVVVPSAAGGQTGPSQPRSTTTTTTTATSTTTTTAPTSTTTTRPPTTPPTTGSTSTTTTTTVPEDDPAADEVLRSGHYASQPRFDPRSNEVVRAEVERARRVADAERANERARDAVRTSRDRLDELEDELETVAEDDRELLQRSEAAYSMFVDRVADAYIRGNDEELAVLMSADDAHDLGKKTVLLESVLQSEEDVFDAYDASREAMSDELLALHDELIRATRDYKDARLVVKETRAELYDANVELKMWEAGGQLFASGFVFPVDGEVSFGDSWGAPRMTGTRYEHWHEGTDIMASSGTPLVVCEDGVISRTSSGSLGGISLYIRGESGIEYYYAHLSVYAPEVGEGTPVRAGDLVGYVGDTGNAKGGSPHLHFEVHARDGRPVNPYPILRVAHETESAVTAIEPGTEPVGG